MIFLFWIIPVVMIPVVAEVIDLVVAWSVRSGPVFIRAKKSSFTMPIYN